MSTIYGTGANPENMLDPSPCIPRDACAYAMNCAAHEHCPCARWRYPWDCDCDEEIR